VNLDSTAGSEIRKILGEFELSPVRLSSWTNLQAGPSFFIEKSKRRMIAGDIGAALRLVA